MKELQISPTDPLSTWIRPDETCDALTVDYRIIQRKRGHRYSVDDMMVGHLACTYADNPKRILDLGCGIGSVLLMTAWGFPDAQLVGVEAQEQSIGLARRNVVLNGCEERTKLFHGDLRSLEELRGAASFDLVTGTPPYFNPKAATPCSDPQRAHAKFELRGGIEDYAKAAARLLSPTGVFVACAIAQPPARTQEAIRNAGLSFVLRRAIIAQEGRRSFLDLIVCRRAPWVDANEAEPIVLRRKNGLRTQAHMQMRSYFGFEASES